MKSELDVIEARLGSVDVGTPIKALLVTAASMAVRHVIDVCRYVGNESTQSSTFLIVRALYAVLAALELQKWSNAAELLDEAIVITNDHDSLDFDVKELAWIGDLMDVIQGAHDALRFGRHLDEGGFSKYPKKEEEGDFPKTPDEAIGTQLELGYQHSEHSSLEDSVPVDPITITAPPKTQGSVKTGFPAQHVASALSELKTFGRFE